MENKALKIGIFISDKYTNPLLHSLQKGLVELGYDCSLYDKGNRYDYVFLFNVAGVYNPVHGDWIKYSNLETIQDKIVFIDAAEYGWWTHYDCYASVYCNAFTKKAIESKSLYYTAFTSEVAKQLENSEQTKLTNFLRGKSFPYFLREKYKAISYPKQYHPIDYTYTYMTMSQATKVPDKTEYLNRKYDFYLRWGNSHIFRKEIIDKINSIPGYRIDAIGERISQSEYFKNLEDSRISAAFDGYGSGSFRETEVLSRCTLFQGKQCIDKYHPLTEGVNFVEYEVKNTMGTAVGFGKINLAPKGAPKYLDCDIDFLLQKYMANWDLCFQIYAAGYEHCMKYYTPRAVAKYVMEEVLNHDYSQPTPVEGFIE